MIIAVLSLLHAILTGFNYSHVSGFLQEECRTLLRVQFVPGIFFSPSPVNIGWTHVKVSLR